MHGNHLKHMLIGAAALLAVFLVAGVPLASALPYAIFLACPLMMVLMMLMMARGMGDQGGHDRGDVRRDEQHEAIDAPRVDAGSRRSCQP